MTQSPPPGPSQQETPAGPRVSAEEMRDLGRLRRSRTDRKVAGIAGGLGRHLDVDPTILRVAFVVLCFFGGAGFVLYGAAWLLVPEEGRDEATISTSPSTRSTALVVVGVLAALLLVGEGWWWGAWGFPWPLALIALIVLAVLVSRDRPGTTTPVPVAADRQDTVETTRYPVEPPGWAPPPQPTYTPPPPHPDRGPKLFWVTLALIAVALGALGLYDVSPGGDVTTAAYPALALAVTGAMLVVGAWFGRAAGLILLGVVAAIALAISSVGSVKFDGERQIDATPLSAGEVRSSYYVPAGSIHLDLSDVADLDDLDGRRIVVEANAGEIVVTLPEGLEADVEADVTVAGEAEVFDETSGGFGVHIEGRSDGGTDTSETDPAIDLDIELLVGAIEVRQP